MARKHVGCDAATERCESWPGVHQTAAMKVFLLWHGDDIHDDTPDAKLLGVYSTEDRALDRIARCRDVPGFTENADEFHISRFEVDGDDWPEGYKIVEVVNVELLDEGVQVWRPVVAEVVAGGLHRLTPGRGGEVWAFPPGSVVRCERRGTELYAVEAVQE